MKSACPIPVEEANARARLVVLGWERLEGNQYQCADGFGLQVMSPSCRHGERKGIEEVLYSSNSSARHGVLHVSCCLAVLVVCLCNKRMATKDSEDFG